MSSKKQIKIENIDFNVKSVPKAEISDLQDQTRQLKMEVDAMKNKYPLPQLLKFLRIAKSSYYYQKAVIKQPDKYHKLRTTIIKLFKENRNCYGHRRCWVI